MNAVIKISLVLAAFLPVAGSDIELIQYSDLRLRSCAVNETTLYRTWTLNSSKSDAPAVTITFEPRQIYGSDGCNRYSAPLAVAGFSLKIGPVMATRAVCEQLKGSDSRFRKTLVLVESYRITDKGNLELLGGDGAVLLTFHK